MFAKGFLTFINGLVRLVLAVLPDIMFIGGAVSVVWGVSMWSIPAAFIVGGIIAIIVGLMTVGKR